MPEPTGSDIPQGIPIHEVFRVLRRRKWQLIIPTTLLSIVAILVTMLLPRKYETTAKIRIQQVMSVVTQDRRAVAGSSAIDIDVLNLPQIIPARKNIKEVVIERVRWEEYATLTILEQQEFLDEIQENVTVELITGAGKTTSGSGTMVTLTYKDEDRDRCRDFLYELYNLWMEQTRDEIRDKAELAGNVARTRAAQRMKSYEVAQQEVQQHQDFYGISPTQPGGGRSERQEDPIVLALEEARTERSRAEVEKRRIAEQLVRAQEQRDSVPPFIELPEEVVKPSAEAEKLDLLKAQLAGNRTDLTEAEDLLAKVQPTHSSYRKRLVQRDKLAKVVTDAEAAVAKASQAPEVQMPDRFREQIENPQYAVLTGEIQSLDREVRGLEGKIQSLEVEIEDLAEEAQLRPEIYRTYNSLVNDMQEAEAKYNLARTELIYYDDLLSALVGRGGDPFLVVEAAKRPVDPVEPNVFIVGGVGIGFSIAVGFGIVFLLEFSRLCFRGVNDASRGLPVPVLGVVNYLITEIDRRRILRRKVVTFMTTALPVAVLGTVGVMYMTSPDLLPVGLVAFLDQWTGRLS